MCQQIGNPAKINRYGNIHNKKKAISMRKILWTEWWSFQKGMIRATIQTCDDIKYGTSTRCWMCKPLVNVDEKQPWQPYKIQSSSLLRLEASSKKNHPLTFILFQWFVHQHNNTTVPKMFLKMIMVADDVAIICCNVVKRFQSQHWWSWGPREKQPKPIFSVVTLSDSHSTVRFFKR